MRLGRASGILSVNHPTSRARMPAPVGARQAPGLRGNGLVAAGYFELLLLDLKLTPWSRPGPAAGGTPAPPTRLALSTMPCCAAFGPGATPRDSTHRRD